jgi:hypothetical protein
MRAYRGRLSFRVFSWLLKLHYVYFAILVGWFCMPFLLYPDFTVATITFSFAVYAVVWFLSIPRMGQTDDGVWYVLDSDERAEWVFENKRFPKL